MNAPANIAIDDATFRATHVGASEVAALFDASPWVTQFELYHRKRGTVATPEFNAVDERNVPENERAYWGVKLEPLIVEAACERWGYQPVDTPHRLSNGAGLGGHPDRIVTDPARGGAKGVLEVKMVDWLQVKKWGDEPPLHYLLQNMTYQGLAGCVWGDMIVLVGGNELRRFQYDFRPTVYADIERRVSAFWARVREGDAPAPDYSRDRETIAALFDDPADTLIDLTRDNRATYACADYMAAAADEKAAKARKEAAAAELLDKLGNNGAAMIEGYSLRAPLIAAVPERVADPGEIIKGRKGYRRIYIKEKV